MILPSFTRIFPDTSHDQDSDQSRSFCISKVYVIFVNSTASQSSSASLIDSLETDENDLVCKDRLAHLLYEYGMVSKDLFLSNL